jgi:hypothetical protein
LARIFLSIARRFAFFLCHTGQFIAGEVLSALVGPLGRYGPRLHTRRQDTNCRVNISQTGPNAINPLFEFEKVPAYLCPLGAENGNNMFALHQI